ncbi:MAG: hypothetical protein ABJN75_17245 [Hoeflea sp.]|uniref:hypothetical protein n=1 Tax=Hoeflea sp. TaxID=1940281 RepID=UPI0032982145
MVGTRGIIGRSGLVRMLCALSLLLVAFAHRPLNLTDSVAGYSDVDVASFILPDGTLPDLCLPGQDGPYHFSAYHCEACRIVSSVDLPSPFNGYVITRWSAAAELAVPQDARLAYPALRPGASPRGPPSFSA